MKQDRSKNSTSGYFLVLGSLLAGLAALSFVMGPGTEWRTLFSDLFSGTLDDVSRHILVDLRLRRILLALIVGGSLALSGTMYQALFRNPLGEPFLIGVSGGAGLGATIAMVLHLGDYGLMGLAVLGALAVTAFISLLAVRYHLPVQTQILVGISLNVICSSMVMLIHAFSDASRVHNAIMWLMGDLSGVSSAFLTGAGVLFLLMTALSLAFRRHLDIIAMDDAFSHNLGISRFHFAFLFWTAALLAALAVAGGGLIGFVGLMAPHIARRFVGGRHGLLIPAAVLGGGFFLLFADTLGRNAVPPYELPVGILTGLAGGIFFIVLVARR